MLVVSDKQFTRLLEFIKVCTQNPLEIFFFLFFTSYEMLSINSCDCYNYFLSYFNNCVVYSFLNRYKLLSLSEDSGAAKGFGGE